MNSIIHIGFKDLSNQQFYLLAIVSAAFVLVAPAEWHYTPDGGIYIGTALNMLERGEYWFNGQPNLLYYPGFSTLLLFPLSIFGLDFSILHLFCAVIVVMVLWLARAYYSKEEYGLAGLLVPILLACNPILQRHLITILSDALFLATILAALLTWAKYQKEGSLYALAGCTVIVAFAPLVRFEGLLLVGAFGLALFLKLFIHSDKKWTGFIKVPALLSLVMLPFIVWTWRNYQLHTPDTFNMANYFFFKLKGLSLYAPTHFKVDWIDEQWKYGVYNTLFSLQALLRSYVGNFSNLFSTEGALFFTLLVLVPGILPWFRLANNMERILFILLGAFFLWRTMRSGNLYVVDRYWLSLLPFITVIAMLGLAKYFSLTRNSRARNLVAPVLFFLFLVTVANGVQSTINKTDEQTDRHYRNVHKVLSDMSEFVQSMTDDDAVIATTDWGVLPLFLGRTSYQVLNDEDHRLTLERIHKYKPELLVILDGLAAFPPYTRKMVEDFPQAFTLMKDFPPHEGVGQTGSIYKINLQEIERLVCCYLGFD